MKAFTIKAHKTFEDDTQEDLQQWLYNGAHNSANCVPKNPLWVGKPPNDRFKAVETLNLKNGFLDHNIDRHKPWDVGDELENTEEDIDRDPSEEPLRTRDGGRIVHGKTRIRGFVIRRCMGAKDLAVRDLSIGCYLSVGVDDDVVANGNMTETEVAIALDAETTNESLVDLAVVPNIKQVVLAKSREFVYLHVLADSGAKELHVKSF